MIRLDQYLAEAGRVKSRSQARGLILEGKVLINGQAAKKPGQTVLPSDEVVILEGEPFVSRGGRKLAKALSVFQISVRDQVCLDAGASTGGFTDCLLRSGAKQVVAADVGSHQLSPVLLADPRVISLEQTDIRQLTKMNYEQHFDFICADLSFISLTLAMAPLSSLAKPGAAMIFLIKPQFEVGKEGLGKGGIVKDPRQHFKAIRRVLQAAIEVHLRPMGLTFSPLLGQKGNREYLLLLKKESGRSQPDPEDPIQDAMMSDQDIYQTIQEAFEAL